MSALEDHYIALLKRTLESEFVPSLPPLVDQTRPIEEQREKNLARAFSAFALRNICGISRQDAAQSVIDDFDDYGVDAIYYHAPTETLYLVQAKLKAGKQVNQEESLAYCQGASKLIKQDFDDFNEHVKKRQVDIEDALADCCHIKLVVAHIGAGISEHAKQALNEFLSDGNPGDERLVQTFIDYDSKCVVDDLQGAKAYERINTDLLLYQWSSIKLPRVTYFGLVKLLDLVALHQKHDKALYAKNIRTFLGHKTPVNSSIQQTLATKPKDFVYLNNGVTALCEILDPKEITGNSKRLKIRGLSVINGAQTIASSAKFVSDNPASDISAARVSFTLIRAQSDGDFGKAVTRARNHQNQVSVSNFAALDDEQERLRREASYLGFHYSYKAEGPHSLSGPFRIGLDEATQALAMLQADPRYVVWLKKEPARLLDTDSSQYRALFSHAVTAFQLINSVLVNRFVQVRVQQEARSATGLTRLAYKHGNYAIAWVIAKRLKSAIDSTAVIDEAKLKSALSLPFDELRQTHWDKTRAATYLKGPLALFRNQTDTIPLLATIMIEHYDLLSDAVVDIKKNQHTAGEQYPEALFTYLVSKAPQIKDL